jgi:hypothetical protein
MTESSKMLDVLKSRYMTGFSAPCKKASPLAAPIAIFILVPHGNVVDTPNDTKEIRSTSSWLLLHKNIAGLLRKIKF